MRGSRIAVVIACLFAAAGSGCDTHPRTAAVLCGDESEPLVARIDSALRAANEFLVLAQSPDGAWRSKVYGPYRDGPTLTPYVLTAMNLTSSEPRTRESVERGKAYLRALIGPDGAVVDLATPVYTAAPACWVLRDDPAASRVWLRYLREHQLNADRGWKLSDPEFGGWGYAHFIPHKPPPDQPRPPGLGSNLSATLYALGALRLSGVPPDDPAYADIRTFVFRCQNFTDDPQRSDPKFDDGGFFFTPNDAAGNKAGGAGTDRFGALRFHSYGGMTADGLRALLHSGLAPDYPRVVAARRWLERHFRAGTNPGTFEPDREVLRDATYYYYCWSVAHAFLHLGIRTIQADAGEVDWPVALAQELLDRQRPDGSWRNHFTDTREDDPFVATPAAAAALQICRHVIAGRGPIDHRS